LEKKVRLYAIEFQALERSVFTSSLGGGEGACGAIASHDKKGGYDKVIFNSGWNGSASGSFFHSPAGLAASYICVIDRVF
jgi:hypothetical protein